MSWQAFLEQWRAWPSAVLGSPEYAWLAWVLGAGLLWGALRWTKGQALPLALGPGVGGAGWLRWAAPLPRLLRYAGLALLLMALLRPQTLRQGSETRVQALDVMLALDVSGSMQTEDLKPNRLEAAKKSLAAFSKALPGERIGLAVFAGKAFTQCPLTLDHEALDYFIDSMQIGTVAMNGTALGDGLLMAVGRLIQEDGPQAKVVVLATDGLSNTGQDPREVGDIAAKAGVKVYTVGMGQKGGAIVRNAWNEPARSEEPDEALMTELARRTGGRYFRATDADGLREAYQQIATLERRDMKVKRRQDADEHFYPFLWAGAFLLLLEALLRLRLRVTA